MLKTAPPNAIRLNPDDNVAVALSDLKAGDTVHGETFTVAADIARGHKVATVMIEDGAAIRKYDQIIGFATQPIKPGEHVHVHNCAMGDFERDYAFCADARAPSVLPESERRTFEGYRRPTGKVGTRNYIGIMTSVNCSASVARFIADAFKPDGVLAEYPNVDGVCAFVHGTGCCMASSGEEYEMLQRTLWGYAAHPNFAAVLMVGLGCEVLQIPYMMEQCGLKESDVFRTMVIQEDGGTRKTVERGKDIIKEMLPAANAFERETVPASKITVALQCGGSDGYSGITANPALGAAVDRLVANGGTGILAETPEIYGAEHLLTRRAASRETGEKLIERIKWWEEYTQRNGGQMNNNPTPGNKAGGLTTVLEKSLGAAAKGGTTNLNGVYLYGQQVDTKGFVFMDSPGYDPCSITGEVGSGANVVCFTTGRGSVYGCKPSPSIKLATNTPMYDRMREDMDVNCGEIVDGTRTVQEKGEEIFELILNVASGKRTKSEELGLGDEEFVPWRIDAVM